MLSHSTPDIRRDKIGPAATIEDTNDEAKGAGSGVRPVLMAPATPIGAARSAATRRVIGLTAELAAELSHFQGTELSTTDVHGLMHGMNCTAAALTRILDQLRESPALVQAENELGLPTHHTVRSELEQAAAAAEDLQTSAEALSRLLDTDVLGSQ